MDIAISIFNSVAIVGIIYLIFLVINNAKKRFLDIDERIKMLEQEYLSLYKEWKNIQGKKDVLLCKGSKK